MNELNKSALNYIFTNDWFVPHKVIWSELLAELDPTKILEVGSYEGASKQPRTKVQFGKALTDQGYKQMRDSNGRYWQGLSISITG